MEAYSKEFRRDVLRACDAGGETREVALRFDVSESWVRRIKQERRIRGRRPPRRRGRGERFGSLTPSGFWRSWTSSPTSIFASCRQRR